MSDVIAAEWLKLRSVRSTYYVLAVAALVVLFGVLLSIQGVTYYDQASPEVKARFQAIPLEEYFLPFVQLVVGILGVLAVTSEYATGTITASLVAVPRRGVMLGGKVAATGAVTLVMGTATIVAVFLTGRWIIGGRPFPGNTAPVADRLPLLAAMGLSVMVIALVGLGLGTLMRSTAGGVVSVVFLAFVLPSVSTYLPDPWKGRISAAMLPNLPGELAGVTASASSITEGPFARIVGLPPLGALAVLVAYLALALGAATLRLTRTDA
ncbi:ABC transporter permease [Sphaerisporangium corydalis]|uniref:ABC transporter permease n=1 Tax=Sphaerisporangium corydalis TaxID=1441875 RepID=A0ABV9EM08_9ACTN|nr:ABC transporter permease [Sphaerisporangium corydalis]